MTTVSDSASNPMRTNAGNTAENTEDKTHKFILKYNADKKNGSEGCWRLLFSWLPIIGGLFKWTAEVTRVRRDSEPPKMEIYKPGIFSFRVIFDGIFLFWLGYLDAAPPAGEDFDPAPGAVNEYTNCGILAALLMTVWQTFLTNTDTVFDYPHLESVYYVSWGVAFILSLISTLMSVLMLLFINETGLPEETTHFLSILDNSTRGFGAHSPVIFLYFSLCFAVFGLLSYLIAELGDQELAITFIFLVIFGGSFVIFYLHSCSAIYVSRHTQCAIQEHEKKILSPSEIKRELDNLIASKGGFEFIESEDEFLQYLREHPHTHENYKAVLGTNVIVIARRVYQLMVKKTANSW